MMVNIQRSTHHRVVLDEALDALLDDRAVLDARVKLLAADLPLAEALLAAPALGLPARLARDAALAGGHVLALAVRGRRVLPRRLRGRVLLALVAGAGAGRGVVHARRRVRALGGVVLLGAHAEGVLHLLHGGWVGLKSGFGFVCE